MDSLTFLTGDWISFVELYIGVAAIAFLVGVLFKHLIQQVLPRFVARPSSSIVTAPPVVSSAASLTASKGAPTRGDIARDKCLRIVQRLMLWLVALCITFLGPFWSVTPAWPPEKWLQAVNAAGSYKDCLISLVGMIVVCGSNILDNLARNNNSLSFAAKLLWPIVFGFSIIFSLISVAIFVGAPEKTSLPCKDFYRDFGYILVVLSVCALTEIFIALEARA